MRPPGIWLYGMLLLGALARTAEAGPVISLAPSPIGFYAGPLGVFEGAAPGLPQGGWYEVRNTGNATLVVTGMAITGPDAGIMAFDGAFDPFCGSGQICAQTFSLAPGASRTFYVTCTAVQAGYFAASLGVTSNATSGTGTVAMSCLGLRPPIIQLSQPAFDFGIAHQCPFGEVCGPTCATKPLDQTIVITNAAVPPSRLEFYITPELPSSNELDDFIVGEMCAESFGCFLEAGASMPIGLTFRPRKTVVYNTPLTLVSYYPGQAPIQIPFHAEGGSGHITFDTPAFLGEVPVGQTLVTNLTIHNSGRSCLSFARPISTEPAIQLAGSYPAGHLLQSGESYTWSVSCTPSAVGDVSGFMDFELSFENLDLVSRTLSCRGTGGSLSVTPSPLAFVGANEVPVGTSATRRVTVRNAGVLPASLVAITPGDSHFTAALVTGSLPLALAPGAEVDVDVTFTPTANVHTSGTIAFDASPSEASFLLEVSGDGVLLQAEATPAVLDFGTVAPPDGPDRPIRLHNTGDRELTINGVASDRPDDFTVAGIASGATLAAGALLAFDVRVTPTALGRRRATLVIDLDKSADLMVPLDVLAIDPALVVTTADIEPGDYAVDFGAIDVGVGPKLSHVVLHNTSPEPISIAACSIAGDADLAIASGCPLTIPGFAKRELALAFSPAAEREFTATVTLTGTGFATGALELQLRGIGVEWSMLSAAHGVEAPDAGGGCATGTPAPGVAVLLLVCLRLRRRRISPR